MNNFTDPISHSFVDQIWTFCWIHKWNVEYEYEMVTCKYHSLNVNIIRWMQISICTYESIECKYQSLNANINPWICTYESIEYKYQWLNTNMKQLCTSYMNGWILLQIINHNRNVKIFNMICNDEYKKTRKKNKQNPGYKP